MGANDKNVLIGKLAAAAKDEGRSPEARLLVLRKLLRESGYSVRAVALARRIAKSFMNDSTQTAEVRKKALSLIEKIFDQRETEEDESDVDLSETPAVSEPTVIVAGAFDGSFETLNKGWDAEPVPKKIIRFFEKQDLHKYGIDLDPPTVGYHTDFTEAPTNHDHETWGWVVLNPRYRTAYAEWKRRRFGETLPGKWSSWVLRFFEVDMLRRFPDCCREVDLDVALVGGRLRRYEKQKGIVQDWELDFTWDLWSEIFTGHPMYVYETPNAYRPGINLGDAAKAPLQESVKQEN